MYYNSIINDCLCPMKVLSSPYAEFKAKDWNLIAKRKDILAAIDQPKLISSHFKKYKRFNRKGNFSRKEQNCNFIQLSFA